MKRALIPRAELPHVDCAMAWKRGWYDAMPVWTVVGFGAGVIVARMFT